MLVKMLVEVSGLRDGVPWPGRGGTVDLPEDEAVHLFEQRMAVAVHDPESGVERAVVDESEIETRGLDTSSAAALVPNAPAKKRGRPRKATA